MTEREYVETIRNAASDHLLQIGKPAGEEMDAKPIAHWGDMKMLLSAHTAIRLCDAWLTMQETVE